MKKVERKRPQSKKLKKKLTIRKEKVRKEKVRKNIPEKSCKEILQKYSTDEHISTDLRDEDYQSVLKCMSSINREQFENNEKENIFLYPHKDDPLFSSKIANKKEFFDSRHESKRPEDYENIVAISQQLCSNTEFELEPHQMFVRNFLSFQTPYNSLLIYHGLGTGKTCSAISVCEEMRTYNKQIGNTKRIIIVASPAVQENFKIQLFDERKLKNINGLWNIKACTGNKFIKEINPMNMKGLNRTKVIKQIKKLVRQSYHFQGYIEFSNYITRTINKNIKQSDSEIKKNKKKQRAIKKEFSNRMLVIDEIHNMRITADGKVKLSSENLIDLVSYTDNLKLLLLSATPMFNSYKEIIWLLNLMNLNDKRFSIREREVFDSRGNFQVNEHGSEIGKDLLIQKATGYISYVRGNNPFTFPNKIWPIEALNPDSLMKKLQDNIWKYPINQINGGSTIPHISLLDLVITNIGSYQSRGYNYIVSVLKKQFPILNDPEKGLSYTFLEGPLQALNMIYPHTELEKDDDIITYLYGGRGLARIMLFDPKTKNRFKYKDHTLTHFGKIFSYNEIGKYSSKIKYILDSIKKSKGIVFVYSQYIDGGAVPLALALEEIGITRFNGNSLFHTQPVQSIDAITMTSPVIKHAAKYIMITGDKNLTTNVKRELKAVTDDNNINGEMVKVVIVSKAGSEGLDFKNIRQMHILDPWYNFNRQEQTIGRAVRNFSHCALPYIEKNVELYLYGTQLKDNTIEAVDMYIYRLAEKKAKQMARVSRILKENAVDCLLNNTALNFSQREINMEVEQHLSSGKTIKIKLGAKDNSIQCDFTECEYKCNPVDKLTDFINSDTYNEAFIQMNLDKILQRIRLVFKEKYIYAKPELLKHIRHFKNYPLDQIYSALNFLITEKNEYITDLLGRSGHLVNIGNYYMFQPIEIDNKHISRYERVHPVDFKRKSVVFKLPEQIPDFSFISSIEEGSELSVNSAQPIIQLLSQNLINLKNPSIIGSEYKNSWIKHCAWAIRNLHMYDKIDINVLISYAMDHLIDSLSFNEKFVLLNYITNKKEQDAEDKKNMDEMDLFIDNYMEKNKFSGGRYKGIVFAQFDKPSDRPQYTILTYDKKEWINSDRAISGGLGEAFHLKFQITDLGEINDIIGFMINFKGNQIVFKTKYMKASERGRSNKGQRCDRGETKISIIKRINNLLDEVKGGVKYKIGKVHRSTIMSIYEHHDIEQIIKSEKKQTVKINSLQLCVESELLLRHFDASKIKGKKWFFSTIDSIINNIEKLKK